MEEEGLNIGIRTNFFPKAVYKDFSEEFMKLSAHNNRIISNLLHSISHFYFGVCLIMIIYSMLFPSKHMFMICTKFVIALLMITLTYLTNQLIQTSVFAVFIYNIRI